MKTFKSTLGEVAQPLSQGEKAFKGLHNPVKAEKLVPGVTDQEHVFNGTARKLDPKTASYEIYKSEDESKENYDKGLKVKEEPYAEEVDHVEEGKANWDKAHKHGLIDTLHNRMLQKKAMPPLGARSRADNRELAAKAVAVGKGGKIKEEAEAIDEKITKKTSAGEIISDFVHSKNPKFAGKSKEMRRKMALGAYYAKQKEVSEDIKANKETNTHDYVKQNVKFASKRTSEVEKEISHDCAKHVAHEEWGFGVCIPECHTIVETAEGVGYVTHYDIEFAHGIELNVPVENLHVLVSENHGHAARKSMKEDVDYDYEGEMAKTELRAMCDKADKLANMLKDDQQLEAWLQSKISRAKDYIDAVYDYMMYRDQPTVTAAPVMPTQSASMASTYGTFLNRMGEEKMSHNEFKKQAPPFNKATFADRLALIKKAKQTKEEKEHQVVEEVEQVDEALGTMSNIKAGVQFGKESGRRIANMVRNEKARKAALSPKQKEIAAVAGDPDKIDAEDFKTLRARKK